MDAMNTEKKSGFAALAGRSNVGKSTLVNAIIGQKVSITSNRPQTTRNQIRAIYNDERGQIVFVDTPGLHKAKNKLGEYMVRAANMGMRDVDVILWLVEASTFIGAGDRKIAEQLSKTDIPVVLVINKIDTVKNDELLAIIDAFRNLLDFADVVPVSALKNKNTDVLLDVIYDKLPEGPAFFDEETVTDQPERQMVSELIREKTLRCLSEEVPHGIAVAVDRMEERTTSGRNAETIMDIDATIICEKDSHKGIIIGKQGAMLKKIGSAARFEIERMLGEKANLKLWVKVKKDWRDSDYLVRNFGYDRKEL